jgi:hypothetical protein
MSARSWAPRCLKTTGTIFWNFEKTPIACTDDSQLRAGAAACVTCGMDCQLPSRAIESSPLPCKVAGNSFNGMKLPARPFGRRLIGHKFQELFPSYFTTWPRISPSGNLAVWILMYIFPACRSAS